MPLFVKQARNKVINYLIKTGYYKVGRHVTQGAELSKNSDFPTIIFFPPMPFSSWPIVIKQPGLANSKAKLLWA